MLHTDGWRRVVRDDDSYYGAKSYIRGDVSIRIRWDHVDWRIHFILERGEVHGAPFETLLQVDCEHRNRTLSELQRRLNGLPLAIKEVLKTDSEPGR
ncbi:hypothetical protein [Singulisphaera sp. PoT]|uniref:hypothetical protein n=1 Tax=Singulisphaera sp. PoT TaxID=3411797 RepID=UPI003BF5B1CE